MFLLYGLLIVALSVLGFYSLRWTIKDRNPSDALISLAVLCFAILAALRLYFLISEHQLFIGDGLTKINEWIRILGIASVLTGLGLAIRESKPVINRAPVALSFIPFLLLAVHPLILQTVVLKELLLTIYSGAAYLIALMLFSLNYVRRGEQGHLLTATILLLTGFVLLQLPTALFSFSYQAGILFSIIGIYPIIVHYQQQILISNNQENI